MAAQYYQHERDTAMLSGTYLDPEKDPTAYRVRELTRKLLQVVQNDPEYRERYQEIKNDITQGTGWKVMTIKDPRLNAYCLPGGRIVVYSAMAELLDDDELAAVISHEVMHAMKQHSYLARKEALQMRAATLAVGAATGAKAIPISIALLGEAFVSHTAFSRGRETEADREGLRLMFKAGFNPRWAITLWEKMQKLQKGKTPPEILSTHPSHSSRIQDIQQEMWKNGYRK
jgi:predicted Zn-dependent protease